MPDIDILIKATDKASGPISQVTGAIDGLNNKASGTAKGGLGNFAGMLGTGLKVGVLGGVAALGGLAVAVGKTGIDFNNLKQQANIAFTTMLGSGDKAKVFLDDLQQFAAATPFEFPDLLSASQRLLAMGFAAEDVKPTLTAVGDAVAGLGGGAAEVDRVTTALGQIQAKGKASAEEMMQLTEAGIPAWQMLADALGTDVAGAMEAVSKGAVDSKTTIDAVINGMNSNFGGMMEKQSQTFGGLLSTLKDTFTQVSGTVMGPLFEIMTEGLAGIVEWTSKPEFKEGVAGFASGIVTAVTTVSSVIGTVVSAVQGFLGQFRASVETDGNGPLSYWKTWIDTNLPLVQTLFQNILGAIQGFWALFGDDITSIVTNTFENAMLIIDTVMRTIGDIITLALQLLTGDWEGAWQTIEGIVTRIWETITTVVGNQIDSLKTLFTSIDWGAVGSAIINGVKDGIASGWRALLDWFPDRLAELRNMLPFSEPKDPTSPLRGLAKSGHALIGNFRGGIEQEIGTLANVFGAGLSNIAGNLPDSTWALPAPIAAGNTTNITSPINVNFYGPADPQTVRTAGRTVRDELRLLGAG